MSLSTAQIKLVRSLREKKFRDREGLFVVEGEKMVAEALSSGLEVVAVYRTEEVGEALMQRLSALSSPPPAIAVLRKPSDSPEIHPEGLCLALDSVRDPGNMGTIMRLSDWFAVDALYASADSADVFNPKVIQASMGSVFRKRPVYCDLPELCRLFREAGLRVFGTFLEGENIYASDLPSEGLVVVGNEARGISAEVSALVTDRITIPSFFAPGQGPESLNVGIAAAISVSEFRRRNL